MCGERINNVFLEIGYKAVIRHYITILSVRRPSLRNGYNVDTQVGNSDYRIDLAVVHPDDPSRYILGIESDGETFQSAMSVRERDVMRRQFLEKRGWTLERNWSRS